MFASTNKWPATATGVGGAGADNLAAGERPPPNLRRSARHVIAH
jgi:hypothetical protein